HRAFGPVAGWRGQVARPGGAATNPRDAPSPRPSPSGREVRLSVEVRGDFLCVRDAKVVFGCANTSFEGRIFDSGRRGTRMSQLQREAIEPPLVPPPPRRRAAAGESVPVQTGPQVTRWAVGEGVVPQEPEDFGRSLEQPLIEREEPGL